MEETILKIENLSVIYNTGAYKVQAVDDISLFLEEGMSMGIIGESGSGKTTIAMAVMGLLGKSASIQGSICFYGTDLQQLPEKQRNHYRWSKVSLVFQNSQDVLNPVLTISKQIKECLKRHTDIPAQQVCEKVGKLLEMVGLEAAHAEHYPHQLSGGMRQRVLLAMALSCDPELLIVDEPTNALDAIAKSDIIQLIKKLHREKRFSLLVISHELNTVSMLTSRLAVMYKGRIVEEGMTKDILKCPMHTYTRGLLNSSPNINPYRDLWGIPGDVEESANKGCLFYSRCSQHIEMCKTSKPPLEYICVERKVACNRKGIATLLSGIDIHKAYHYRGETISACIGCNIEIRSGEIAVLIGESGSGKTTLAGILSGVLKMDKGDIVFNGDKVTHNSATRRKNGMQIVFQDPYSSINENFTVEQAVREPLDILKQESKEKRKELVKNVLKNVQLPVDENFIYRRLHTLSGGQRQRTAIARALVMEPMLLIADEISAMLDPSTQANILRLLKGLQNSNGFAMLYITHDLALAQKIADSVFVMHKGRIIEHGSVFDIFNSPRESYTNKLVSNSR